MVSRRAFALSLAAVVLAPLAPTHAQDSPADLASLPPVVSGFIPGRTEWGDPDLRGIWPTQRIVEVDIKLERPKESGRRVWLTPEEYSKRLKEAQDADAGVGFENNVAGSSLGLADWVRTDPDARRTSLIVDPPDGRLPPLTPAAQALTKAGKSSWEADSKAIDWVADLDTFDRCITRGLPSIMLPMMNNNAVRIFQAPGLVVLKLETLETRLIPLTGDAAVPDAVRSWMGFSRGHWEGSTLVIETTHIRDGDATGRDPARLAASPAYQAAPIPVGARARLVERLTMVSANRLTYEATYTDPEVFTAPWTARFDWSRDDSYRMFEYACHEGNVQLRHMINASRAERREEAAKPASGGRAKP